MASAQRVIRRESVGRQRVLVESPLPLAGGGSDGLSHSERGRTCSESSK